MDKLLFSRYHPAVESYEDLQRIFVGADRKKLLELLVNEIRRAEPGSTLQPHLIVGPRGIGKTHLLWLLFHRLNQDPEIAKTWIPVVMREELFDIDSFADILLGALAHLASRSSRAGKVPDGVHAIAVDGLKWTTEAGDPQTKFNRVLSIFEQISSKQSRRCLLVVENLDMLSKEFPEQELENFQALISRSISIKLVGSATTIFDAVQQLEGPLYGYFREHRLQLLQPEEVSELVSRLLELFTPRYNVAVEYLQTPDGLRQRHLIKALVYLSGGLPRMVFPLFEFAMAECGATSDGPDALSLRSRSLAMLKNIFDGLTEVYVDRLKNHVPPAERKILMALASADSTLRPKDISARTGMSPQQVSNHLMRLAEKRLVRVATLTRGREQFYLPTEPLFGLWDQWRRGASNREKWSFIPDLLAMVFGTEELKKRIDSAGKESTFYRQALERAPLMEKRLLDSAGPYAALQRGVLIEEKELAATFPSENQTMPDRVIRAAGSSLERDAKDLFNRAVEMHRSDRLTEAIGLYDQLVKRYKDRNEIVLAEKVAMALFNKGILLSKLKRFEEAIRAFDQVTERYKDRNEMKLAEKVAKCLVNKGILLILLKRFKEAIRAFDQIIERYRNRDEVALAEKVAIAMVIKGTDLSMGERLEEAIQTFDQVIERYRDRDEVALAEKVAIAMVNKGAILGKLERFKEAINIYDKVIEYYIDRNEAVLVEQIAMALVNKGSDLGRLERFEEAIQVFDQVVELYKERDEVALAENVSMALVNKGIALGRLKRLERAIQVYDQIIELYSGRDEAALVENIPRAMFNKGIALATLDRGKESLESLANALEARPDGFRRNVLHLDSDELTMLMHSLEPAVDTSDVSGTHVLAHIQAGLIRHELIEGNAGKAEAKLGLVLNLPDEGIELLSFLLIDLLDEMRFKEANLLSGILKKQEEPPDIGKRLGPLYRAARICGHITDNEPKKALEIVQGMGAAERETVLRLLGRVLDPDWLRIAQDKAERKKPRPRQRKKRRVT